MILVKIILSLTPVLAFLAFLVIMDSFKLVKLQDILLTILTGCMVALAALLINGWLLENFSFAPRIFSRYPAPLIEESLKALFLVYLIRRNKIGFMIDGTVYGFAIGTGFALLENIYYLQALETSNLLLWTVRGFGTAVMHGGTTATFAILSKNLVDRKSSTSFYLFFPGLTTAVLVHAFFNHFLLSPVLMTLSQLIILSSLIAIIFNRSEKSLREWMNIGLDTDVQMLEDINAGSFSETPAGQYLHSLKDKFPGEVVVDMFCLLRLHLELACQAKGFLLLREAGFPVPEDPEIREKFTELEYLQNSIGKTGKLAISPILQGSSRELWQLYLLKKG
jgi:RsiW-degrading membrane proteinase PrsW (M82 family)